MIQFAAAGDIWVTRAPQDFTELVQKETREWGDFVRESIIRMD